MSLLTGVKERKSMRRGETKKEGEVGQRSYCTKCVPGMYPRYSNWPTRFSLLGNFTGRISKQAKAEIKKRFDGSILLLDGPKEGMTIAMHGDYPTPCCVRPV